MSELFNTGVQQERANTLDLERRMKLAQNQAFNQPQIGPNAAADLTRLRAIEAAARELIERHDDLFPTYDGQTGDNVEALRNALSGGPRRE